LNAATVLRGLVLAAGCVVIAGVAPAVRITGRSIYANIRSARTSRSGNRLGRLSSALIVIDVAVAVVAIAVAGGLWVASESLLKRIRLSEPQRGGEYRITPEPVGDGAISLAISADGHRFAYSRNAQDSDIYRLDLPGKDGRISVTEKHISSVRTEYLPDYSPDGRSSTWRARWPIIPMFGTRGLHARQVTGR
jgi:hypothetical protein